MKRNKWKIAFWSIFAFLILVVSTGTYLIIDQGYSYAYLSDDSDWTRSDFDVLKGVIVGNVEKSDFPKGLFNDSISDSLELLKTTIYFDSSGVVSKVVSKY